MEGCELDSFGPGRRETSRALLTAIHNRVEQTFHGPIERYTLPGSTIQTDGQTSDRWLNIDPRFIHMVVTYSRGKFTRILMNGVVVLVNEQVLRFPRPIVQLLEARFKFVQIIA